MNPVTEYRETRGLSYAGMSRIMGVGVGTITAWEDGFETIPPWVIVTLEAKRRMNMRQGRMK